VFINFLNFFFFFFCFLFWLGGRELGYRKAQWNCLILVPCDFMLVRIDC
jgi:hypothetical protein